MVTHIYHGVFGVKNMKSSLQIQDISVPSGTKAQGFLNVVGTSVKLPIVIVNGANDGQTLLVTAGIHGGEYPSIEAAIRFGRELDPTVVNGAVIVMSPVSLNAFHARQAFLVPEDGKNLNRVFPGKALGTVAERMAYTIMNAVAPHISAWVDLHGGDIPEALIPLVGCATSDDAQLWEQSLAMAEAFGIPYLMPLNSIMGTTVSAATALGIPALLAEAGQLGILDEPNTELLLNGCRSLAQHLAILAGEAQSTTLHIFNGWPWVRSAHSGCWYPTIKVGDIVKAGDLVGVVKDYFGDVLGEYTAPADGLVLLVCAALSVNVNDPLVGIGS